MSAILLLFSLTLFSPKTVMAEPVAIGSFSRAEPNAVSLQLESLASNEGLGNCPPVFLRIKSQNRPENLTLQDDMNELIASIITNDMSFVFGLMINLELTYERIRGAFFSCPMPFPHPSCL